MNAGQRTLLLVHTEDDDDLVAADANELLDTADAPPAQLRQQNHALGIVVLEELDVRAHFGNLPHLTHDNFVRVRQRFLVEAHGRCEEAWRDVCRKKRFGRVEKRGGLWRQTRRERGETICTQSDTTKLIFLFLSLDGGLAFCNPCLNFFAELVIRLDVFELERLAVEWVGAVAE